MARMIRNAASSALVTLAALATVAKGQNALPPELPDPEAVRAFKQYWGAFEEYERKLLQEGREKFSKSWNEIQEAYAKERRKLNEKQIAMLRKAAEKYRHHLQSNPQAENRPYVMLNLAQVLNLLGDHYREVDANAGTFSKNEALVLLREIADSYPDFTEREQALYLRAIILESLDKRDEALTAWKVLAETARKSLHGVHARIAVGDRAFEAEDSPAALESYEKALKLLPDVNAPNPAAERVRINYRIAWAAFRSGELERTLEATLALLEPGLEVGSTDARRKIQSDAVDLTGDALYEMNDFDRTRRLLTRKDLSAFAPGIGLRALSLYHSNGIYVEAARVGDHLAKEHPLAKEAPAILQLTADAHDKLGESESRIASLERLAMLLPAQSLWRSRHRDDFNVVRDMENRAIKAAEAVSAWYYDRGLASGNPRTFMTAASFYEILIAHAPNVDESNNWRLRQAHCHYFAGRYDEAATMYAELKSRYKVDAKTLEVASYQLVLANEKRWREGLAKAVERGHDPLKDQATLKSLGDLEKSIDEFAARFPGQSRSVDLLLVAASANRDMDRFENASRYWQRALVSNPSPAQRGIAIRGMIFATMKTGSTADVVEAAKRFLKLEDWKALGLNLGDEIKGILSVAALDEGKRLNDSGQVMDAGRLLTNLAREFPDLPDRDRIYRDGAYMLAIAGDWAAAESAASDYLQSNLQRNRGDMTYLLARAHEYQIRLHEAAKVYLDLGDKFPQHSRAQTSLQRAERLATAEGDFALAAQAAAIQAERSRRNEDRLQHYARAVEYLEKAEDPKAALNLARQRMESSRTPAERYRSELLVAKMTYANGSEQQALDDLTVLARKLERDKDRIGDDAYAEVAGETYFLLGEEARRRFQDFDLFERSGALNEKIRVKTGYFESMVDAYDKAAAAGHPRWASEARFRLAEMAEAFADEVASVATKSAEPLTAAARKRYDDTVKRLQDLAKRYYSTNVLAARKAPDRYKDNEWVKKSAIRLTGFEGDKISVKHDEHLPTAASAPLPSQWNL